MKKILFLIAPSEAKNSKNEKNLEEKLSFPFPKPKEITENATEKDLKCSGKRFDEALILNLTNGNSGVLEAIFRYTGVQYNHLDYQNLSESWQKFFDENVLILSGMYGIVRPQDLIGNYKLPIETRGLYQFWGNKIAEKIIQENPDFIVNLLPKSYEKLLNIRENMKIFREKKIVIINVNFIKSTGEKISHNNKIHRGKFLRKICENGGKNFLEENFVKISENFWELNYISE